MSSHEKRRSGRPSSRSASLVSNSSSSLADVEDDLLSTVVAQRETRLKLQQTPNLAYLMYRPACSQLQATMYLPHDEMIEPETVELLDNKERVRGIIRKFEVSESSRRVMCADIDEWVKEATLLGKTDEKAKEIDAERAPWTARSKQLAAEENMTVDAAVIAEEMTQLTEHMHEAIADMRDFGARLFTDLKSDEENRKWQSEMKQRSMKTQGSLTDFVVDCSLPPQDERPTAGHSADPISHSPAHRMRPFPPPGHMPLPKELFSRHSEGNADKASSSSAISPRKVAHEPPKPQASGVSSAPSFSDDRFEKEVSLRRQLAAAEQHRLRIVRTFQDQINKLSAILERFRAGRRHEKRLLKDALETLGFDMPWATSSNGDNANSCADHSDPGEQLPLRSIEAESSSNDSAWNNTSLTRHIMREATKAEAMASPVDNDDDAADFLISNISSIVDTIRMQERRSFDKSQQQRETLISSLQQQVTTLQQQLLSPTVSRANFRTDAGKEALADGSPGDGFVKRQRDASLCAVVAERDVAVERARTAEEELSRLRVLADINEGEKRKRLVHISDLRKELDNAITEKEMVLGQLREKEKEVSLVRLGMMKFAHQQIAAKDKEVSDLEKEAADLRSQIAEMEEEAKRLEAQQDKEIDALEKANEGLTHDLIALLGHVTSACNEITAAVDTLSRADEKKHNLMEVALSTGEAVVSRCCNLFRQIRDLPSMSSSAFSRIYARANEGCQQSDRSLTCARDALDRVRGGHGVSGVLADLRAQLQAATHREEQAAAQQRQMQEKHLQQIAADEALREDTVNIIRMLQNAIGAVTRVTVQEQLRSCELVLPLCGPSGAARRGSTTSPATSPTDPSAEVFLSQAGEIAIAAFAAVKQKIWKLLAPKSGDGEGIVLDTTPLSFQQALSERMESLRRMAVSAGGLQEQLRLMRLTTMTYKCLIRPARALIAALAAEGITPDPDTQNLLLIFTRFEETMRENAGLVITSLVRYFKFEQKWVKLSRQSTLLSAQCVAILDRMQFAFQRTDDLDSRRLVTQRLGALRKIKDRVVANLEARFQELAMTYEQNSREASAELHARTDCAVRLLRDADANLAILFGERLKKVVDEKEELLHAARHRAVNFGAKALEDMSSAVRSAIEGSAADLRHILTLWQRNSREFSAEITELHQGASSVLAEAAAASTKTTEEAGAQTLTTETRDANVNTVLTPLLAEKSTMTTGDSAGVSAAIQASATVSESCAQTDALPAPPAAVVVVPQPEVRRASSSVSSNKGSPAQPLVALFPAAELTVPSDIAILSSSSYSVSARAATADQGVQTEVLDKTASPLVPGLEAAPMDVLPPPGTPLRMARHRRQVLHGGGSLEKPTDLVVHGECCPRFVQHHHGLGAAGETASSSPAPITLVNAAATQTDTQLLYDYIAVVSKMMLQSSAAAATPPETPAPPSIVQSTVARSAVGSRIPAVQLRTVVVQPQEDAGQWHSFFKSRRPVSAKR
jgi:hypothetical protein